jgi:Fe-S-cluster containining protein
MRAGLISKICESCATKCCVTEPVFLTQYDINIIVRKKGLLENDFVIKKKKYKQVIKSIRFKNGACLFFDKVTGKCKIYEFRPLDCQLFPLDIDIQEGKYIWIFYTHCDLKEIPVQEMLNFAKLKILPLLKTNLKEYVELEGKLYKQKKWVKIEEVVI